MRITVAIVDDEKSERDNLYGYFEKIQEKTHTMMEIELFPSGEQFLSISGKAYDLICLDIDMQGMNGIEVARRIRKEDPDVLIIFITNLAQMAICGYEVHAFDFILKPVHYDAFYIKIQSAVSIIMQRKTRHIVVPVQGGIQRFSTNELLYVEVQGHYVFFHTLKEIYRQKISMNEVEEKLKGMSFVRCNNCYLVNLRYVDGVVRDDLLIHGETLKISRPRKKEFLQALGNYMGGRIL